MSTLLPISGDAILELTLSCVRQFTHTDVADVVSWLRVGPQHRLVESEIEVEHTDFIHTRGVEFCLLFVDFEKKKKSTLYYCDSVAWLLVVLITGKGNMLCCAKLRACYRTRIGDISLSTRL